MWRMVKEIISDARYIVRNRKRYGDLEVAKAKRIQAENILKSVTKRAIREEKDLLEAKKVALRQLGGMKEYKKALDEHNEKVFESLQDLRSGAYDENVSTKEK